ncbi:hypothetical protein AVEN_95260-1 [Araneus ventricosus]|uniref:RNA-directed DNA polymerase n=1 Tax=Araneus ventricosus TaxID=182803 RepID=A0A4Y2DHL6_ARAVE|nr:hypothetical protein AVEN_95260-1 [Araneus ventricosus]
MAIRATRYMSESTEVSYTMTFKALGEKNPRGDKSGDLEGHVMGPPRSNHQRRNNCYPASDLEQVFQRFNEKGLVLNIKKCIFEADQLLFLGCVVPRDGISPSKEKVEALIDYPQPQDFSTDIRYISGIQNTAADAFSRIDKIGIPLEIDYEEIARAQADDEELLTLQGNIHPYVPNTFRTTIINAIHSLAHSGAKATANAVKQQIIWISLKKDCTEFRKLCIPCQKSKGSHVKSPKGDFSLPPARFSHIHLDVVGPLPLLKATSTV